MNDDDNESEGQNGKDEDLLRIGLWISPEHAYSTTCLEAERRDPVSIAKIGGDVFQNDISSKEKITCYTRELCI
jgi:hypothetical protein